MKPFKKSNKKELLKYENALRINIKKSINSKQKYNSEIKISKLVKEATFIPYMIKVNYKKLEKLDLGTMEGPHTAMTT